jgi:hypothetical protein
MKIVTNNQPRDILTWYDLTSEEQKEFDYLEGPKDLNMCWMYSKTLALVCLLL